MKRKCIKVVKTNNYKGLCIGHTFVKREFSYNPTNKWLHAHQMTVNGKVEKIKLSDLLQAGAKMGIKESRCKDIISEIGISVNDFGTFAEQVGIKEKTTAYINSIIAANMVKI